LSPGHTGRFVKYFGDGSERDYHLITIWSAPNYSYKSGNDAAVMALRIVAKERELIIYKETNMECEIIPPKVTYQYFS
jgi:hypothetical protein